MHEIHINAVDLNLLRVLDALLEERSVTRAGVRLGLSQSAVSHALRRLRETLDDDLFVRGQTGMEPTLRARELGAQVHAALAQLQAALTPAAFDPGLTERRFLIASGSYGCAVLAPALVARMAEQAPNAHLAITEVGDDVLESLDSRRVDFVVGGVVTAPERLAYETLLKESLVWVVRFDNPRVGRASPLDDIMELAHVTISREGPNALDERRPGSGLALHLSWEDFGGVARAIQSYSARRRVGVTVPDTYSALAVVRRSDMVALMPRRLATLSAEIGLLRIIEPEYETPTADVSLVFLRERLAEPGLAWMRGLLREVATSL
jgi:DNA-binding transcriptional LysR family regulator